MRKKIFIVIALAAMASLARGPGTASVFADDIDPFDDDSQYVYGENVGWLNFEPSLGPGVTVSDSAVIGYVWAENIGWINLAPAFCSGDPPLCGVFNDGTGQLSGYAWGENVGWINFGPVFGGGVYIDACGDFNGWAWGENIGWINFGSPTTVLFRLTSAWVSPIDKVPPQTWPDIEIPEWFNADVSFNLVTSDCGEGTKEVHYTVDGGDEVVIEGDNASLNITGDGEHTLVFYSVDNADPPNIEVQNSIIIRIDTTPPVITLNGSATMTLECGIDTYTELGASATDAQDPDVPVVIGGDTVDDTVCGVYVVTYQATDDAGNSAQLTRTVTVQDTIPPAISIASPPDLATYYIGENILADFDVTDGGSGIASEEATVPAGSPIDTATSGYKEFAVSATDKAGNSSSVTHSYTVGPPENIDPHEDGSQYAYGQNVGWLNLEPGGNGGPGVTVTDAALSGYMWGENIGWINLSPTYGGVVNDGTGNLSGYAWGENIGWINFAPLSSGVTIDDEGNFNGWAWGENIGWIHFQNLSIPYKVQTAWFIPNQPPVAVCQDVTVSAGPDCTADASIDDGSYDPDGDAITLTQDPPGPYGLGDTVVTLTVTDEKGASDTCSATVTVLDDTPPVFTVVPEDLTVECDGSGNTVELNAWLASAVATDVCGSVTISNDFAGLSDGCAATGSATVTWTAVDESGNTASCSATFTIVDTTAPVFSPDPVDEVVQRDGYEKPEELNAWLNAVGAEDACGNVTIKNDFPDGGFPYECGNTGSVTVTWTAEDDCGNTDTRSATFTIEDPTAAVTYDGDLLLSTGGAPTINANLIATLRDSEGQVPDIDDEEVTFTLTFETAEGFKTIVLTALSVDGVATAVRSLEPAIYMIKVKLGCSELTGSAILVVYNPDGGFATGGGWIRPEDDGENTHPNVRANFGFNAKYKKGQATGHLEFRYSDGYIDLKSTSVDLLVITGGKIAQFKGWASVNGEPGHWYFVKAVDNGEPGAKKDEFDIKIWAPGVSPEGDPTERARGLLQGGNIVVHTKDK